MFFEIAYALIMSCLCLLNIRRYQSLLGKFDWLSLLVGPTALEANSNDMLISCLDTSLLSVVTLR